VKILLSLQLPDDVAHIPMLRRVSREALTSCKASPSDVDEMELLIGELAANAARHAHAPFYRMDLELYDGLAVVTVTDTGSGFQRDRVPDPGTVRLDNGVGPDGFEGPRIGGWGLPMVETLADSVEYLPGNPQGTVVRASRRLTPGRE
jgi:anti-sigma regulatory factor (Ser/Thr protein kinase)